MISKPLTRLADKKAPDAEESHQSIEAQTRAFLARGGKVESVTTGETGIHSLAGNKQIVIGHNMPGR